MRWSAAGLQESIYNLLDENTGYLSAWVRASATKDEDKDRINAGYEAVVRDQAQVLAKVLREGDALGREGILNALWDFHIRHYALPKLKADTVSIGLPAVSDQVRDRRARSASPRLRISALSRDG